MKIDEFFLDGDLKLEIKDNLQIILVGDKDCSSQVFGDLSAFFSSRGVQTTILNENEYHSNAILINTYETSNELEGFDLIIPENFSLLHFMGTSNRKKIYLLKLSHLSLVPILRKGDIIIFFRLPKPEEEELLNIKNKETLKLKEECFLLDYGYNPTLNRFRINLYSRNFFLTSGYNIPFGINLMKSPPDNILYEHCSVPPILHPLEYNSNLKKYEVDFQIQACVPPFKDKLLGSIKEDSLITYKLPINNETKKCVFWKEGKCSLPKNEMPFQCKIYPFILSKINSDGKANFTIDYSYNGLTLNSQDSSLSENIDYINDTISKNLPILSSIRQIQLLYPKTEYIGEIPWSQDDISRVEFTIFYKLLEEGYRDFSVFEKIAVIWTLMLSAKNILTNNSGIENTHELAMKICLELIIQHKKIEHKQYVTENFSLIQFIVFDYKKWVGDKKISIIHKGENKQFDGRNLQEIKLNSDANQFLSEIVYHLIMSKSVMSGKIEARVLQYIEHTWWILSLSKWVSGQNDTINREDIFEGMRLFDNFTNSRQIEVDRVLSIFKDKIDPSNIIIRPPLMQLELEKMTESIFVQCNDPIQSIKNVYFTLLDLIKSKQLIDCCYLVEPKGNCFGILWFDCDKTLLVFPSKREKGIWADLMTTRGRIYSYINDNVDINYATLLFTYFPNKINSDQISISSEKNILLDTNVLEQRDIMYIVHSGILKKTQKLIIHPAVMNEIEKHKNSKDDRNLRIKAMRAYNLVKYLKDTSNLEVIKNGLIGNDESSISDNILIEYCKDNDFVLITNDEEVKKKCDIKSVSCFLTRQLYPKEASNILITEDQRANLFEALSDILKEKNEINIIFPRATIEGRSRFPGLGVTLSNDKVYIKTMSENVSSKLREAFNTVD